MIATRAAKIRKQDAKSALLVEDQAAKSVQNIHHVGQPPEHVAKEANGVKNLKEVKKDDYKT